MRSNYDKNMIFIQFLNLSLNLPLITLFSGLVSHIYNCIYISGGLFRMRPTYPKSKGKTVPFYRLMQRKHLKDEIMAPVLYLLLCCSFTFKKNVPFCFATSLDKLCIALGFISSMISAVCEPFMLFWYGTFTEAVLSYASSYNDSLPELKIADMKEKLSETVQEYAIRTTMMGIITTVFTYISIVLFSYSSKRQIFKLRQVLLEKTLEKDIEWYETHQTGDFATTLIENVSKWENAIGEKIGILLFLESVFVTGLIMVLIRGWKLALVCFISLPTSTILIGCISWISSKFSQRQLESYAASGSIAEEVLSYIRTVVAFDGQKKETERYHKHLKDARNINVKKSFLNALSLALIWVSFYTSFALSWWFGIGLFLDDRHLPEDERVYSIGNVASITFISLTAMWSFQSATPFIEVFAEARGAAEKIFRIIDEDEPKISGVNEFAVEPSKLTDNIKFNNVSFSYPSRPNVKVLEEFSLEIKCGKTVALVGSSGCGKSTCIQLLQRFYDVERGKITIDDIDIRDIDVSWLRKKIGVVSQEPSLFAITIAENIRYGNFSATRCEIEEAAKKANIHDYIVGLPNGYETVVGERGAQLSGGQKQRIAIARALVRRPEILLLDEATSALDTTSEAEVQAALDKISGECTTIVVAHRLSTIKRADMIVSISNGWVVENGTHIELLEAKGEYYKLVSSQRITDTKEEQGNLKNKERSANCYSKSQQIFTEENHQGITDAKIFTGFMKKILWMSLPEWKEILFGCFASVLNGLTMPLYCVVYGIFMGIIVIETEDRVRTEILRYCLYLLFIGVTCGMANFLQTYSFSSANEKLTLRIRKLTFEAMLKQEMGWYDREENCVGSLCAKLSGDASSIQGASGMQIGLCLQFLSTFLLSCFYPLYLNWKLSLVFLSFSPFVLASAYFEQKSLQNDERNSQRIIRKSAMFAVEAIANIRTVKSLGCERVLVDSYSKELSAYENTAKVRFHIRGVVLGLARAFQIFPCAAGLAYGAKLIENKELEHAVMFTIAQVVMAGCWSLGNALSLTPNIQKAFIAAGRIFELLERVPAIRNVTNPVRSVWNKKNIQYNQVTFSYPTRPSVPVLNSLNLSIPEGKTVALVGSSGCGKSTILHLLERFYDPVHGGVEVDGKDIKFMDISVVREQMSIVSQEPNLFDRTIAENIAYGVNHRNVGMEEIIEAAKSANIHTFVMCLPQAYDTRLGSKGTQLSGGQKQRIAIARALIRKPKILLLDEATSALDNESEKVVQEALNKAMKGRTCIIIAHRLTTIQDADVICVMKDGSVVEIGTHLELLGRRGLYFNFHTLQAGQE